MNFSLSLKWFSSLAIAIVAANGLFAVNCEAQVRMTPAIRITPATATPVPVEIRAAIAAQQNAVVGMAATNPADAAEAVDAQAKAQRTARLQKLDKLTFNRLPSNILETWYRPTENKTTEDLPPAPKTAFLESDVRFKIVTENLQRNFTLGDWDSIAEFLKLIPEANSKSVYKQILSAAQGVNASKLQGAKNGSQTDPRTLQPQYLSFDDIISIAKIAPQKRPDPESDSSNTNTADESESDSSNTNPADESESTAALAKDEAELRVADEYLPQFSSAFRLAIARGSIADDLISIFKNESESEKPVFTERQMAKILFSANLPIQAVEFLPELEKAQQENDHEALNFLSQHYLAIHAKEKKAEHLEQAWHVTQAILAAKDVDQEQRKSALARAVKLSSQVSEELGSQWLAQSFSSKPETGKEVLGAIGADTSSSMKDNPRNANGRLERLKLQNDAVNSLLAASEENAKQWNQILELLAMNWLREANLAYTDDTSTAMGPSMQRDRYGNIFYFDSMNGMTRGVRPNGRVAAIKTAELLEIKPSDQWLNLINPSLRPKFDSVMAQLYLKVSEQDLALPYMEKLAATHPKKAEELVEEFLTVWTKNHNPNSDQRRTNSYMFMYGFESRAESIPLTRSKQERNLVELSDIVKRLKGLVEEELDDKLLVKAFVTCHSTAEVYRLDEIERVFGPVKDIKAETIAELAAKMRTNLATMWRDAKLQKDKKTKRKKKEMEQEVVDGYELAQKLVSDSLKTNADEWSLVTTQAELLHDENNYRAGLKNSSDFSPRRKEAMKLFKKAAQMYAEKSKTLEEKDYSTRAFTSWYYASLGACDLNLIEDQHRADPKQAEFIKGAIEGLPEKISKWHMSSFANLLFNRMSSVKPQLKHKYLDVGFKIVGEHKQAKEAKKVHDYYKDLVNEIRLETAVDGDSRIGHDQPFGVHVRLVHTKEIERESGGFGRYLQNQNSNTTFSYNYGRPTEDYRDKFEEAIREAYSEQFEILSITFQKPEVKSIPAAQPGWRMTPYAYMLLKAKGPEVDKIPPAHLDLDFLDTSGYAILPVESSTLPVDASEIVQRPFEKLAVSQILDERQAEEGKLIIEVKATAQGLVPSLEEIMTIAPEDFEVSNVDDQGVSIVQFDPEERVPTVNSERDLAGFTRS